MEKYAVIFMLILFSCQNTDRETPAFTLREEKRIIDLSGEILSPIISSFSLYSGNQKHFHLFIDRSNNLVITDLQSMELKKVIPIRSGDGPEVVNSGLHLPIMIDSSYFLVESFPNYYIIDDKGLVIKEVPLNNLLRAEMKKGPVEDVDNLNLSGIGTHVNKSGKGEYIFNIKRMEPFVGGDYPLYPQFAKVRINKNLDIEIEILPIDFPEEFVSTKGLSYGYSENPNFTVNGDWLVYNYYFSSQVYLYNLKSGEKKALALEITTGENFSAPSPKENPIRKVNIGFADILYDDSKKIIYRNHIVIDQEEPMEGVNYLTAYSFESDPLLEYRIGSNSERLLRNAFIFEEKLYMNPFYPNSDEELELFEFQLIESINP